MSDEDGPPKSTTRRTSKECKAAAAAAGRKHGRRRRGNDSTSTPDADDDGSSWRGKENTDTPASPSASSHTAPKSRGVAPSSFHRRIRSHDRPDDGTCTGAADASSSPPDLALGRRPPRPESTPNSNDGGATPSPPQTSLQRLQQILSDAQIRLVQNKRREVTTTLKIRRAAFRDVTSLKSWPLQELALEDLDGLLGEHLGVDTGSGACARAAVGAGAGADGGREGADAAADAAREEGEQGFAPTTAPVPTPVQSPQCGFESDSTGVSTSSVDEPKRSRSYKAAGRSGGGGGGNRRLGRDAGGRPSLRPTDDLSPGKSTLRARYVEEFKSERAIRAVVGGGEGKIGGGGSGSGSDSVRSAAEEEEIEAEEEAAKADDTDAEEATNFSADTGRDDTSDGDSGSANAGRGDADGNASHSDNDGTANDDDSTNDYDASPADAQFLPPLWCLEPRIFSVEKSAAGKRRYVVGHLGRFLDLYWRKVDARRRHYYELIRENTPCRLYFDLEFCKLSNPDISLAASEDLMTDFIEEICAEFQIAYDISIDRSCIIDLDSSTPKKFSRHLIVHLPRGELFADAPACGIFVRNLVGRLAGEVATGDLTPRRPALARHLLVRTKAPNKSSKADDGYGRDQSQLSSPTGDGSGELQLSPEVVPTPIAGETHAQLTQSVARDEETTCFVDLGVYTRNRLFRLLGSAKYGKPPSAALRIAEANVYPFPEGFGNDKFYVPDQERAAMASDLDTDKILTADTSRDRLGVACDHVSDDHDSLDYDDPEIAAFLTSMDWSAHAQALASTLVVPVNVSKLNFPVLPDPVEASDCSHKGRAEATKNTGTRQRRAFPKASNGPSPFPCLDDFISHVLGSRGTSSGSIRAWSMDSMGSSRPCLVTYHMKDNRWCERIGRPHKGNNIMWTADLQNMFCFQTCHDPDCRAMGFRGKPIVIPEDVQAQMRDILFEYELATFDEEAAIHKARSKEQAVTPQVQSVAEEDDFEKALLALDISGNAIENNARSGGKIVDATDELLADANKPLKQSFPEGEWSDALSQALFTNPELFP